MENPIFGVLRGKNIFYKLQREKNLIGRSVHCDIVLINSSVSNRHAVIEFVPTEEVSVPQTFYCILRDLRTTNGTYLNNNKISPTEPVLLKTGDFIRFGFDSIMFRVDFEKVIVNRRSSEISGGIQHYLEGKLTSLTSTFISGGIKAQKGEKGDPVNHTVQVKGKFRTQPNLKFPLEEKEDYEFENKGPINMSDLEEDSEDVDIEKDLGPKKIKEKVNVLEHRVKNLETTAERVSSQKISASNQLHLMIKSIYNLSHNLKSYLTSNNQNTFKLLNESARLRGKNVSQSLTFIEANLLECMNTLQHSSSKNKSFLQMTSKRKKEKEVKRIGQLKSYCKQLEKRLSDFRVRIWNLEAEKKSWRNVTGDYVNLNSTTNTSPSKYQVLGSTKKESVKKLLKINDHLESKVFKLENSLRRKNKEVQFLKISLKERAMTSTNQIEKMGKSILTYKAMNDTLKRKFSRSKMVERDYEKSLSLKRRPVLQKVNGNTVIMKSLGGKKKSKKKKKYSSKLFGMSKFDNENVDDITTSSSSSDDE